MNQLRASLQKILESQLHQAGTAGLEADIESLGEMFWPASRLSLEKRHRALALIAARALPHYGEGQFQGWCDALQSRNPECVQQLSEDLGLWTRGDAISMRIP